MSITDYNKASLLSVLLITGCGGDSSNSDNSDNSKQASFTAGPFTAEYYQEQDGDQVGVGSDGSYPDIVPELIETKVVSRSSIYYSTRNSAASSILHTISPNNFYAVWEGELNVSGAPQTINVNFDMDHSDVSFYVDDELVAKWKDNRAFIPLELSVGTHSVRIEFHNHNYFVDFNASFTRYPVLTVETARDEIAPLIGDNTRVAYVSSYDAKSELNEITVELDDSPDPVFLTLVSYESINWVIDNPHNVEISGIVFNTNNAGSSVSESSGAPVFQISDLSRSYESYDSSVESDIINITERSPYFFPVDSELTAVEIQF
ncbi:MAG: hypothetical protein MI864_08805 [Pseudomonadales bacterium]|nr:hypothetical protein [Pseudomonadales bacterium]